MGVGRRILLGWRNWLILLWGGEMRRRRGGGMRMRMRRRKRKRRGRRRSKKRKDACELTEISATRRSMRL